MTVRIEKPAFNLREKLSELDYGRLPYEKMTAGGIIQVVQSINQSDTRITTSSVNFITASITPRSSANKILIMGNLAAVASRAGVVSEAYFQLFKNGSSVFTFDGISPWNGTANELSIGSISFQYIDTPNTNVSIQYALNLRTTQGQIDINDEGGVSSLTLMEIAS